MELLEAIAEALGADGLVMAACLFSVALLWFLVTYDGELPFDREDKED